jgi:hypothetical protein
MPGAPCAPALLALFVLVCFFLLFFREEAHPPTSVSQYPSINGSNSAPYLQTATGGAGPNRLRPCTRALLLSA